ncbi:hypothetical protein AAC387_Pa01g3921 [Persea americana]
MAENDGRPFSPSIAASTPGAIEDADNGSQSSDQGEMKIFVKVLKTIALKIKKTDTIRNIKARFQDEEGIPETLQEMFFAGNHLNNNQTLADCNIQKHSTLHMFVQSKVGMQIFIKIPSTNKSVTLDVKPWDTIQNIKAIIHDKEKVAPEQQRLIYAGRTLEDSQTLAAYDILAASTLHLVICPTDKLQIFINTPEGNNIMLDVKIWYTIEDVKVMIESILGVPLNALQLIHAEKTLIDSCTLIDYNIGQGSTLHLTPIVMQIFVKTWEGKTITVEVQSSDTVSHVMAKIEKKLGSSICHQHLIFSGRRLENHLSLVNYNIQKESTIQLVMSASTSKRLIYVRAPNKDVITLVVAISSTINDVKEMVYERIGIPTDKQLLLFCGKELHGGPLVDYKIVMGSVLHLLVLPEKKSKKGTLRSLLSERLRLQRIQRLS